MATGITISSTSNLTQGQQTMIASARMSFEPAAPNPDLVDSVRLPEGHRDYTVQTYERLADAASTTEGTDISDFQQLATAYVNVTPSERGIMTGITRRAERRQLDANLSSMAGMFMGGSMRRAMDKSVITSYDSFTSSTPGATSTLDISHLMNAHTHLTEDSGVAYGVAPMPLHASLHPRQVGNIVEDLTNKGMSGTGFRPDGPYDEVLRNFFVGEETVYGVSIFRSANQGITGTGATASSKGGVFSRAARVLVMEDEARVEPDYFVKNDLDVMVMRQAWIIANVANAYGVEINSLAVAAI